MGNEAGEVNSEQRSSEHDGGVFSRFGCRLDPLLDGSQEVFNLRVSQKPTSPWR